jgi:hypothetical protein
MSLATAYNLVIIVIARESEDGWGSIYFYLKYLIKTFINHILIQNTLE